MTLFSFDRSTNWGLGPLRAAQGHIAGSHLTKQPKQQLSNLAFLYQAIMLPLGSGGYVFSSL